jgi:adenylate kinase family enzyme
MIQWIYGESGSGKTTLARKLLDAGNSRCRAEDYRMRLYPHRV